MARMRRYRISLHDPIAPARRTGGAVASPRRQRRAGITSCRCSRATVMRGRVPGRVDRMHVHARKTTCCHGPCAHQRLSLASLRVWQQTSDPRIDDRELAAQDPSGRRRRDRRNRRMLTGRALMAVRQGVVAVARDVGPAEIDGGRVAAEQQLAHMQRARVQEIGLGRFPRSR